MHRLVRKRLALPFLPVEKTKAVTGLQAFTQYLNNTWISSSKWHPSSQSIVQQFVITNNETEESPSNVLYTPNANMADLSAGLGLVVGKQG